MKVVYNGDIVNEGRRFQGYVVTDGETIDLVCPGMPSLDLFGRADDVIDAEGGLILPGVIDDHVHFRDPGLTHKADMASESRAAVAGGVTSFMDMPNTVPNTTTVKALEEKFAHAAQVSAANYSFYIGATNDNLAELKAVDYRRVCGVKAFLGSSTGGMLLSDPKAMRRVFSETEALIAIHSEDEDIIRANRARYVASQGENLPLRYHELIRSREACFASTERAVNLARECNTRLHILHISTADELALLNEASLGEKRITAEACIAHLSFNNNDYERLGNRIKCNPAVKSAADQQALQRAVNEGLIDVIGTDHAPHLLGEKQGGCLQAASGMPMVQFSLVVMLELARRGIFKTETVIEKMCHAPAQLFGIERRGYLMPGYKADIAVVVPVASGHTITDGDVLSKCGWTPLEGFTVHHRVKATLVNGHIAYMNGQMNEEVHGQRLIFTR